MNHETILRAAIAAMLSGEQEPNCYRCHVPGEGYVNDGTFITYGTRADYLRQLERDATNELENMNYAIGYAEPGHTDPARGILFADWNKFPRETTDALEKAGYAIEWSDEWTTCEDCNKAIRTSEDSFCWKPAYNHKRMDEGTAVCVKCEPENMFFLFELRDSDGNDCSVSDLIIEAQTLDDAREKAGDALDDLFPEHESDGLWGTYAPCDCHCEHQSVGFCELEACDNERETRECSHGGATVNGDDDTVKGYETFEEAREAGSKFHRAILIDADGSVR